MKAEVLARASTISFVEVARRHGVVDVRYSGCKCCACRDGLTCRAVTMFYLAIWQGPYEAKEKFADEAARVIRGVIDESGIADQNALVAVWNTFEIAVSMYGSLARDAVKLCVECGERTEKCLCPYHVDRRQN